MNKFYTSKLYFKKYPYKIVFLRSGSIASRAWPDGWSPYECTKWLNRKKSDFRVYTRVKIQKRIRQVTVTMALFLYSKKDYDLAIKKYKNYIVSITEPFLEAHIDLLKDNTHTVLRPTLIYNRFRYIVIFRRGWDQPIDDLDDWVSGTFSDKIYQGDVKWVGYGYNPRLYLVSQEDLVAVKLTWGEKISKITVFHLIDDTTV